MDAVIGLLVLMLVAIPLVAGVWVVVNVFKSRRQIEDLAGQVQNLHAQLRELKRNQSTARPPVEASATQPAGQPSHQDELRKPAPSGLSAPVPVTVASEPPKASVSSVLSSQIPPVIPPANPSVITPAAVTVLTESDGAKSTADPSLAPKREKESIEMRVGTYWAVRVGVVMLLTGVAFFANYAYRHVVPKLGPAGKISLLYLVSGLLLGAGAWWLRRNVKESLRNYAQVLFAGGLAAVYFTTYAAHHFPPLCVIGSAVVDGALLLGWAGVIAWIADRRKSEVMALFAVGLAFYSSVITRVGDFTLYSNLILTIAAVVFLIRNRWATLSFAGLATSYAGYVFWRFLHEEGWRWAGPDERLGFGASFLAGYWLVFTVATFLSRHDRLSGKSRAAFLTLNNSAFYALFLLTMLQVHSGGFWKFTLICGTVLLALCGLAKKMLPGEPLTRNAYLTQGLLLVTLGFITKFAGLKLALVLGVESVVLYLLARQRSSLVLKCFAYAAAVLALTWDLTSQHPFDTQGLWVGVTLGMLMTVNAFFAHRKAKGLPEPLLRAEPAAFTLIALASWLAATWFNTSHAVFPLVLAVETVVLTLSIYVLRLREVALFGQFFLVVAQVAWLFHFLNGLPPWWNPVLLIVITLGLSHWWQHQKIVAIHRSIYVCYATLFALASMAIVIAWLHPLVEAPGWLVLTSLLALGATLYGIFTRAWVLAICGQIYLAISAWEYLEDLLHDKPEWYYPLVPLAVLGTLSFGTMAWFARRSETTSTVRRPLLQVALFYRWMALLMSMLWIFQYVPVRQQVWVCLLASVTVFVFAVWRCNREALLAAASYASVALVVLWVQPGFLKMDVYWANVLSLLALLGMQQILRRHSSRLLLDANLHAVTVMIVGASLWRLVSCWVTVSGMFLTMSWAGFAVAFFGFGIVLRERFYRWFGLGVLAASVGRVVVVDVWRQETIYQVLTLMALGLSLLVIGFIYNKYQEIIRKWL